MDVSDPIYLLGYLFLGTAAPPEPFPRCGERHAQQRLNCEEHSWCRAPSDTVVAAILQQIEGITVPEGYTVDVVFENAANLGAFDLIRNPAFGAGFVDATVEKGTLRVRRIRCDGSTNVIGQLEIPEESAARVEVRSDSSGVLENDILISAIFQTASSRNDWTELFLVSPDGRIEQVAETAHDDIGLVPLATSTGAGGYVPGAYTYDGDTNGGQGLYHLSSDYVLTRLAANALPPGRQDLDLWAIDFDLAGLYGFQLTVTDWDANQDRLSAVYQVSPDVERCAFTSWGGRPRRPRSRSRCSDSVAIRRSGSSLLRPLRTTAKCS